ncbi:MAG TPA: endonuclease [Candidatus Rifleibacterium sp.]|nr:endonuclease [Candidatus Rifleibacterium sp.]HPT47480.1 endonuclease [Candidatus Rifleibacterium sp.]
MITNVIKTGVLVFGFVAASGVMGVSAQEGTLDVSAREKLLQETLQLLDRVENESPKAHADLVKIRERLLAIHKNPVVEGIQSADVNPELVYYRQRNTPARQAKKARRTNFQESVKGLRDDALRQRLHDAIANQKVYDYGDARRLVMLKIDNHEGYIECIYTGRVISADTMPKTSEMNIEHTWPQSKGATGPAKSDMHHLFPTDPVANSTRSSLPFGEVSNPKWQNGGSECDQKRFEIRKKYRGNSARAMFYFAVRYNKNISAPEEDILRQWHKEDPVDATEKSRNEIVESVQGNRNPFIDNPEYVDQITDF